MIVLCMSVLVVGSATGLGATGDVAGVSVIGTVTRGAGPGAGVIVPFAGIGVGERQSPYLHSGSVQST